MDTGKAALVVGIMLLVVVFINVGIYSLVTRNSRARKEEAEVMRKVINQAIRPLDSADHSYDELSQRVAALKTEALKTAALNQTTKPPQEKTGDEA